MRVVMVGTSLGWQAMFAALMYGISIDGYELIPHRFMAADALAKAHAVDGVKLFLEDAATGPVRWADAKIMFMTGLNWDLAARIGVYHQLPVGILCLLNFYEHSYAYSDDAFMSSEGTPASLVANTTRAKLSKLSLLAEVVTAKMPWTAQQNFYLYQLIQR